MCGEMTVGDQGGLAVVLRPVQPRNCRSPPIRPHRVLLTVPRHARVDVKTLPGIARHSLLQRNPGILQSLHLLTARLISRTEEVVHPLPGLFLPVRRILPAFCGELTIGDQGGLAVVLRTVQSLDVLIHETLITQSGNASSLQRATPPAGSPSWAGLGSGPDP
ncbi:hypothetical protein STPH1_7344 [Streptomyces sp. OM5714]|nr:hypothetical protein STPH1_7344 [Streptomyces sp. OM5714]